jgi:hypothetical protein
MAYTTIDDPSAYFQATTYTGAGANTEVTNSGNSDLKPDFLWIKNRTAAYGHFVVDSNRNISYEQNSSNAPYLEPESTAAENNNQNWMQSVNTNGFTTGISEHINNNSGSAYVAWQWKANGGTTTSKSSGTVAGNVTTPCVQQVNTDAGFSIITYTASTSYAGTETHLEHGLGVGPKVLIVKRRDTAADWAVYHAENGASPNAGYGYLLLNSTAATATSSTYWLNTPAESNSTLLAFGNNASVGADGGEYVCYAFAEKQGYSKFGKYVGNGSTDGPFVYTGFKPAFVMIKNIDNSAGQWYMYDNKRDESNVMEQALQAQGSNAEITTSNKLDFVSNGIKHRGSNVTTNQSGSTHIYMAFAENPFVTSTGVPTTAR